MIMVQPTLGETLAALHASAFDDPWTPEAFDALLASPGVTVLAETGGFILIRTVADEAEILTLAVQPEARRLGLGRALVERAAVAARAAGAERLFLEVAADNRTAIALYRRASFDSVGLRRGYYPRTDAPSVDALVLARPLVSTA